MKRITVFVLLTLLLLPLVFADSVGEVHRITIKTTVQPVSPVFQFEFTAGMEDEDDVFSVVADKQRQGEDDPKPPVVYVPDIKVNDLDLTFTAKLANEAKCLGSYTLTFIAGNFNVVRDGVGGILAPVSAEMKIANDFASRGGVVASGTRGANSVEMTFIGSSCTTGDLAIFEVKYEADPELDEATYYADISLEVSSNN